MISKILKLFGLMSLKEAKKEINIGYSKGYYSSLKDRNESSYNEVACLIGKSVISFGNEWTELIVGEVIAIEQFGKPSNTPLPVIKDFIRDEAYISFGHTLVYSDELLDALLKLSPYERYNIASKYSSVSWDAPKLREVETTLHELNLVNRLRSLGIYTK